MQQDYKAELRVDKIEVNPFALSLRVEGLSLDNPNGEPTVRIEEAFANVQLSSLFRFALAFDEVRISSAEAFVSRNQAGEMDFAYLIKPSPEKTVANKDASLPPLLIYQFTIEDLVVHWVDQIPVEAIETRFGPIAVDIKDLSTLPNQSGRQTVVIATQDIGTLSWTGDLQLNPFQTSAHASLEAAPFALISAYIRHQAGVDIVDGSADIELDYEVHQGKDGQIKVRVENFDLTLSDIAVNSFADGSGFDFAGDDQRILTLPKLVVSDGLFLWPEQKVSLKSVSLDRPQIDTMRNKSGVFNLEPSATLADEAAPSGSTPAATANDVEWQVSIGDLSVKDLALNVIDQSVAPAAQLGITDFNLTVSDLSNQPGARFPMNLNLQAQSGGKVSLDGAIAVLPQAVFDFDVSVEGLQLAVAQPYLRQQANLNLDSGALNLTGKIQGTAEEAFAYSGNFSIADLAIAESVNNERLVSWKSLSTDKLALSLGKRELEISELLFDRLYGDILIDKEGRLNVGQVAVTDPVASQDASESSDAPVTEEEAKSTGTEFKINIGGIRLREASADFADLSLPLPFAVKIDSLNGNMTTISNQSVEPSEVSFEGKVDEFGLARISGTVTPLDAKKNTNILLAFDNIEMPKFTAYSIPFAGRKIAKGYLDLELGYQLKDSQLVGANSIILRDFELGEEVPYPGAMDLPLGLAVALLKDSSGKIAIDLPITGNVDNPEFNYGGVVRSALGDLLVKIVLSPFSFLANLLGIEASELENINFIAGRSDLTPPEIQRAGKLVEALSLRPGLHLLIKGVSDTKADSLALQSAQLNKALELRIAELTASSDPSIQYPQHRRAALEQLASEQLGASAAAAKLTELEAKFTTQEAVEGQTELLPKFDTLAYVTELNQQLALLQELDSNALNHLADARAKALQTALLAIDENLQSRIGIAENISVTGKKGEPVKMPITLTTVKN